MRHNCHDGLRTRKLGLSPPTCEDHWSSNPVEESKEVNEDAGPSPSDQVPPSPSTIGTLAEKTNQATPFLVPK